MFETVTYPLCPICGSTLEQDDMISDYVEGTILLQDWKGHCRYCNKRYRWTERYEYLRYMDMEELE